MLKKCIYIKFVRNFRYDREKVIAFDGRKDFLNWYHETIAIPSGENFLPTNASIDDICRACLGNYRDCYRISYRDAKRLGAII